MPGGSPTGRRLARNTQLVLIEESNLARVVDPAGGAWYVEHLTDQLARAAWAAFPGPGTGGRHRRGAARRVGAGAAWPASAMPGPTPSPTGATR